jgi:hypothetical protein
VCARGARWVRTDVLGKFPSARLRVYAVWQPILPTDFRFTRRESLLADSRVIHLWDRNKAVGRWFATYRGGEDDCFMGDVAWDLFYLFGPDAHWGERPDPLVACGGPVIEKSEKLAAAIRPLLVSDTADPGSR